MVRKLIWWLNIARNSSWRVLACKVGFRSNYQLFSKFSSRPPHSILITNFQLILFWQDPLLVTCFLMIVYYFSQRFINLNKVQITMQHGTTRLFYRSRNKPRCRINSSWYNQILEKLIFIINHLGLICHMKT